MGFFYTGKGDKGCSIIGKKKYPKDSPALEILGELDELNSLLGLAKATIKQKELSQKLERAQETLFIIQARIAWFLYPKFVSPQLKEKKIKELEKEIERAEQIIKPERGFVVSGGNQISSWLDYLRAVSRRVERKIFTFSKKKPVPKEILVYMNRLSSYFYALARLEIFRKKIKERKPTYR